MIHTNIGWICATFSDLIIETEHGKFSSKEIDSMLWVMNIYYRVHSEYVSAL